MSSKRATHNAQLGSAALPQPPATKRARADTNISALPDRFLPCHLVMLRSLYATDNNGSAVEKIAAEPSATTASVDSKVKEEVWHLINVFLANRGDLATSRDKAIKSQAVYESAEHILNEGIGGIGMKPSSSSNGVRSGQSLPPVPSTPLLRTGKLSPSRSIGVGTSTPVDMPVGRQDHQHDHLPQNQNGNAWTLVTKLLGRKNAATQKDTELVAEPYQPLIDALNSKLKELRSIYKKVVDEKSFVDGDDDTERDMLVPFNNMGEDDRSVLEEEERQGDNLARTLLEEEDLVAKLECKLYLWSLLLSSVRGVVG